MVGREPILLAHGDGAEVDLLAAEFHRGPRRLPGRWELPRASCRARAHTTGPRPRGRRPGRPECRPWASKSSTRLAKSARERVNRSTLLHDCDVDPVLANVFQQLLERLPFHRTFCAWNFVDQRASQATKGMRRLLHCCVNGGYWQICSLNESRAGAAFICRGRGQ